MGRMIISIVVKEIEIHGRLAQEGKFLWNEEIFYYSSIQKFVSKIVCLFLNIKICRLLAHEAEVEVEEVGIELVLHNQLIITWKGVELDGAAHELPSVSFATGFLCGHSLLDDGIENLADGGVHGHGMWIVGITHPFMNKLRNDSSNK